MPNSYYNHGTTPATNAPGSSAAIRAEFDSITTGFGLLPTLAGAGNQIVAINAGGTAMVTISAIDGIAIGQVTPAAGKFTTLQATGATTLAALSATSIDTSPIGQTTPAAGKFTTLVATGLTTLAAMTATGINSTPIGGTTPAAGAFTTLSATGATTLVAATLTGNLTLSGTGLKFIADLDNATLNNRFAFQTSTLNQATSVEAIPNGSGTIGQFAVWAGSDRTNQSVGTFSATAAGTVNLSSLATGSGTVLPMVFLVGSERARILTTGGMTISAPTSGTTLALTAVAAGAALTATDGTVSATLASFVSPVLTIGATSNHTVSLISNNLSRVAIAGAGNVTVNAPTSGTTLALNGVVGANALSASDGTASFALFLNAANGWVLNGSTNHPGEIRTNNAARISLAAAGNVTFNAPASGIGLTVNGFNGTHSTKIADSATNLFNAGYLEVPQNVQNGAYTAVLADAGKHIYCNNNAANAWVIPANASVAYPTGTTLTFVNDNASVAITVAITTDTNVLSPGGTTGTRTIAAGGRMTALKIGATRWQSSGTSVT